MTSKSLPDATGTALLVDGPSPPADKTIPRKPSAALVAATLASRLGDAGGRVVLLSTGEAKADDIARTLAPMVGDTREVLVLPPWDCLPYDHASPSRESQGRRLMVLARLASGDAERQVLVLSPEAAMQRLPPRDAHSALFELKVGETLDRHAFVAFAARTGYVVDDRIDEPGEIAFLGEVIDVFPAAAADRPLRIGVDDDRVQSIRWFDPVSQRSDEEIDAFALMGASELHLSDDMEREAGAEHGLASVSGPLDTVFERLGASQIFVEAGAIDRCERVLSHVREAHATAKTFSGPGSSVAAPTGLYLSPQELGSATSQAEDLILSAKATSNPQFAIERSPGKAVARYMEDRRDAGRRVVFCASPSELKMLRRFVKRQGIDLPEPATTWEQVRSADEGELLAFAADPGEGFDDPALGLTVLTTTDILGARVARNRGARQSLLGEPELRVGDVVSHEDHGIGLLQALERKAGGCCGPDDGPRPTAL